jgi:signal transduction histidine kinase/DNA-binding NarL/FixJ family response regulator/CHASE3 domain sensor protein/HPt (histidine-containing phosphotransfer) domain-containing protein
MTRSFIELKIGIMIIVVVAAVIAAAYVAFNSLSYIAESIQQQSRPDLTLVILKDIRSDILKVESNVKYYSLTGNSQYLNTYYDEIITINSKIEELKTYTEEIHNKEVQIDSFNLLLKEKLKIWKQMLSFRRDNRVNEAFNKLTYKLETATDSMTLNYKVIVPDTITMNPEPVAEPEKKSSFFSRLFKRKTETPREIPKTKDEPLAQTEVPKDTSLTHIVDTTLQVGIKKSLIKKEISQIKAEEGIITKELTSKELAVLSENEMLNFKLDQMIIRMENEEIKSISDNAREADLLAFKTNKWIAYFVLAASLVLLLVFFVILNYIRKSNKYQKALMKAKDEAEKLSLAREQFVANMSHEIRTPMNALTGFTEQLLSTQLKDKQHEQLTIVKKSADHLMHIINDILDFSKLEAGMLKLEIIPFDPEETFIEAFKLFIPSAESKNIELKYFCDPHLPQSLYGDPFRLRQILFNLLNNAIKFTPAGSVQFASMSEAINNDKINLIINITDTGIGIPESKFEKIFEEFTQAEMNTTRQYGGTGLGLSIVKKLVDLHNGKIDLKSKPDEGTSFILSIPYNICHEKPVRDDLTEDQIINFPALQGTHILVADDDDFNKKLISTILGNKLIPFTLVNNGKEVVEMLERGIYDVVLMDIRMPVMDGMETTIKIRQHQSEVISKVPIIALTATITKEEEDKYKSLGMNAVMSKPFTERHLFQTLLWVIGHPVQIHGEIQNSEIDKDLFEIDDSEEPFQIEKLYKIANNDEKFVKEMMQIFVKTTEEGMQEIQSFSKENNWEEVANQSHKIKAPCKHMGVVKLANYLKIIEDIARNGKEKEELPGLITEAYEESSRIIESVRKHLGES